MVVFHAPPSWVNQIDIECDIQVNNFCFLNLLYLFLFVVFYHVRYYLLIDLIVIRSPYRVIHCTVSSGQQKERNKRKNENK